MTDEEEARWRDLWLEARAKDIHPILLVRQCTEELTENE